MRKPPFQNNDAPRIAQPEAGQPIGWLRSIKEQIVRLRKEVQGLELRIDKRLGTGEPAAIVAKRTFLPETFTFDFQYQQLTEDEFENPYLPVKSQYVLRDGVTYEIPIVMPPPGVMLMRSLKVKLYQRLYVEPSEDSPLANIMQMPMNYADFFLAGPGATDTYQLNALQTKKFAFPDGGNSPEAEIRYKQLNAMRRCSFLWNLIDTKSGAQLSDELLSDQALLPMGTFGEPLTIGNIAGFFASDYYRIGGNTGRYFEFDVPWLFERDAQLTFLFRPITPVIQPTADSGYFPYPWNDLEQNGTVRNSAVTVQIELHGTRYVDDQDARREGAKVD